MSANEKQRASQQTPVLLPFDASFVSSRQEDCCHLSRRSFWLDNHNWVDVVLTSNRGRQFRFFLSLDAKTAQPRFWPLLVHFGSGLGSLWVRIMVRGCVGSTPVP